ncbi:MAG: L-threonylcarbamoyladenylate synthase [Bdellovibrionaceae bacterium]|nr:L-threonylcarbamoyladenylate synthase [Pseudobdellovibrionaceae bacterium]
MQACITSYIQFLKQGKVIAFPTDTVWGLSVDACNTQAVDNLVRIKNRPADKRFSVLIPSVKSLSEHATLSNFEKNVVKEVWPGSFSIVCKAKNFGWASRLGSLDGTVAFRCINNDFVEKLLNQWEGVLITTSANVSGSSICNEASSIRKLNADIKICSHFNNFLQKLHIPSTVIKVKEDKIKVLRKSYQYKLLANIAFQNQWVLEA